MMDDPVIFPSFGHISDSNGGKSGLPRPAFLKHTSNAILLQDLLPFIKSELLFIPDRARVSKIE
jgi:hypothetical protein